MNDVVAQNIPPAKYFGRDAVQKPTTEARRKSKTYRGSTRMNADQKGKTLTTNKHV
jgi:hypothetical protein